jgi:hypothetical protein
VAPIPPSLIFGSTNFPGSGSFLAKYSERRRSDVGGPHRNQFPHHRRHRRWGGQQLSHRIFLTGVAGTGDSSLRHSNLTSQGQQDIFIAKYDAQANLAWVKQAGVVQGDSGWDVDSIPPVTFTPVGPIAAQSFSTM